MSAISTWSTTPAANNASAPNGFPEGMAPSGVNDGMREIMARIREWYEAAQWVDLGHVPTRTSSFALTLPGNLTTIYTVGRRVRFDGTSVTYGTISASTYTAPDTTLTIAEANVPTGLTAVAVSILTPDNSALPTIFPAGPVDFTGGNLRATGNTAHAAGTGLEIGYDATGTTGVIQAFDRTANAARGLRLNASSFSIRVNGVQIVALGAASAGVVANFAGAIQIAGPATLGADSSPGIWSYEYPAVRYYIGDGTGYVLHFSVRSGSATTDAFTFLESGVLRVTGPDPIVALIESDASADNGRWRLRATGESLVIQTYNDADNAQASAIVIERTGTTVDSVAIATKLSLAGHATASSASAGGASALPALPTGYVTVAVNGADKKIPYYD